MKKITHTSALICLALALLLSTIAYAWLSDGGLSSPANISSNIRRSYFERGNGTEEHPYVIARPVQLYYFSWLQYLGYFNNEEDGETLYFKVDPIDLETHESIDYLDMTGFTLPPIGTVEKPFIGNFNGNDNAIRNLTVANEFGALRTPPAGASVEEGSKNLEAAEIIGFFGVIGEIDGDYDFESSASQVYHLVIENITVKTQTDNALIGLVAGYVNGKVDKVGVVGSTIVIAEGTQPVTKGEVNITNNLSDYALIGYCTDAFKNQMFSLDLKLYDPLTNTYQVIPNLSDGGNEHGWGGSIKMSDIFTWLNTLNSSQSNRDGKTTSTSFVLERVDVVTLGDKHVTISNSNPVNRETFVKENFGSFVFTNSSPDYVNFISGGQKVTQFKYVYTEEQVPLYNITDGTHYLCFNGSSITSTTSEADATAWYINEVSGEYNIYTVVNNTMYYLDLEDDDIVTLAEIEFEDQSALPVWTVEDGELVCDSQKIECDNDTWKVATSTSYLISLDGNYLSLDGTTIENRSAQENPTVWTIEFPANNRAVISIVLDGGITRYLSATATDNNNGSLQLSDARTEWTYNSSNNNFYLSLRSGNRTRTYYLSFNGSNWVVGTSSSSSNSSRRMTLTKVENEKINASLNQSQKTAAKIVCEETEYIDNSTQNYTYDKDGNKEIISEAGITYFPLSTTVDVGADTYTIAGGNTGYIVGAEWGAIENNEHDQYGNIRISTYGEGSIRNKGTPYTISYKTQGKFKAIPELPYEENSTEPINLSDELKTSLANLGLQKYADCYQGYRDSVLKSCDGLHFMEASVSMSNIATLPYAYLNYEEYTDYQVPTNCIDFNLYDQGFINFVAGSYFDNNGVNDSFFSLYEIERNADDEITSIKEIYKVYAKMVGDDIDTSAPYVYTYQKIRDGGIAGKRDDIIEVGTENIPEGYTEVFDCMWMIFPDSSDYYGTGVNGDPRAWRDGLSSNQTKGDAYYYEIPVNAGEYAIGSSAGRTGAYLVYLDLAANAQVIERTRVDEKTVTVEYESTIPNGVSILEQNNAGYKEVDIDSANSAFVSIGENWSGEANFSQSGNVITDSKGSEHTAVFVGSGIELRDENNNLMNVDDENITKTITVETSTYYDNNLVTGDKTLTVIKKTTVEENGETSVSYTKDVTVTSLEGVVTNKPQETSTGAPLAPDVPDPKTGAPGGDLVNSIMNAYYVVSDPSKFALDFEFTPAGQEGAVTSTYAISSTNTTGKSVRLTVSLTALGAGKNYVYQFNGQTIGKNTDPLVVTVENQTEGN